MQQDNYWLPSDSIPDNLYSKKLKRKGSALVPDLHPAIQRYAMDRVNMALGGTGSVYRMHKLLGMSLKEAKMLYVAHSSVCTDPSNKKRELRLTKLDLFKMLELLCSKIIEGTDTGHPDFSIDWDKYSGKGKITAKPQPKVKLGTGRRSKKEKKYRMPRVENRWEPSTYKRQEVKIPEQYLKSAISTPKQTEHFIEVD